jgi:UDP-glucose 4-epimerase
VALRFAVTGANGFVGRSLVRYASSLGHEVVGVVRSEEAVRQVVADGGRAAIVPALAADALLGAFGGCAGVVHLAQIGHESPGVTYDEVNVRGTEAVAAAALGAGARRVVFFSGLGVARFGQKARCTNRYFLSKIEAEQALYRSCSGRPTSSAPRRRSCATGCGSSPVPASSGPATGRTGCSPSPCAMPWRS